MKCPECGSPDVYFLEKKPSESGEDYEVSVYECNSCGEIFDEEGEQK